MSYVKHNFVNGNVLNASQLNQMDDQIALNEAAAAAATAKATAVETSVQGARPDVGKDGGKRLNDIFVDADALHTAISTNDWTKINVGDYWEYTLNGQFWDYGNYTLPAGATYYSDTACTTAAGTVAANTAVSSVIDADEYCEIKVGGTTYYCKNSDCLDHEVKSINNALMKEEIAGIQPYYRYGDSGDIASGTSHVYMVSRDCLPVTLKMRPSNNRWMDMSKESFEVSNVTGTYTLADSTKKIRCVRINGHLQTYNTHYTVSSVTVTLKAAAGAVVGDTLDIWYTDDDVLWRHTSVYKTLNDEEHGIASLLKAADQKLWSHIKDMRMYMETCSAASTWGIAWANRGMLNLPTETEVFGANNYGHAVNAAFRPQLPIFSGSQLHISKGIGNGAGRSRWWEQSFSSLTYVCYVYNYGAAGSYASHGSIGAAVSFVLS